MERIVDPIRSGDLHQAIQDRIKRVIIDHGYQPGDALPAETELARILGISRGSLREAMKSLQTLGVVETRHGFGTFVGQFSFEPMINGLTFQILVSRETMPRAIRELLDLRQVLETALMPRVTEAATAPQLEQLELLVARMEASAARGRQFVDEDREFHEVLYRPLGNDLIIQLLRAFWDIFNAVGQESSRRTILLGETAGQHRDILDAIVANQGQSAAAAMSVHFAGALAWVPLLEHDQSETMASGSRRR